MTTAPEAVDIAVRVYSKAKGKQPTTAIRHLSLLPVHVSR